MSPPAPAIWAELTPMFGRTEERDRVIDALSVDRLVTLTGAAGFGKTRLARACGRALRQQPRFASRVWFADLTACRGGDDVSAAVADALGLVLTSQTRLPGITTQVRDYLDGKGPALLVLDNAEHLVSLMKECVPNLLKSAPGLHILATSRETFGLAGERRLVVGPLGLATQGRWTESPAVQLFVARATAIEPTLAVNDHLQSVAELVKRLDGNPLAIELAAARSTLLTPPQMLERLDRRFELLCEAGSRTDGLWGAIDESWAALSHDEQHLLMGLALFRRGASIEAAEALVDAKAGEAAAAMNLLSALVRKSLVVTTVSSATPEVRRLDLYESIRAFARKRLTESGEEAVAVARHRAWFRRLGARLATAATTKAEAAASHAAALADLDNLLDMLDGGLHADAPTEVFIETVDVLLATRSLIGPHVPRPVVLRQFRSAMDRAGELDAPTRVRLLSEHGGALAEHGDEASAEEASTIFADALVLARELNDLVLEGQVLYRSARLLNFGPPELTIEALTRAISLLGGEEHHGIRGRAHCTLGLAYLRGGDYPQAQEALEHTLRLCRREDQWEVRCLALNNYALLNGHLGRWGESKRQLLEALELMVPGRHPALECVIRGNIGECCLVERRFAEAEGWIRESQAMAERCGYGRQVGMATGYLAALAHLQGDEQEAYRGYSMALDALAKHFDDPLSDGLILAVRAVACAQMGHLDEAERDFTRAYEKLKAVGDPIILKAHKIHRLTAELALGQRTLESARVEAHRHVEDAEQLADTQQPPLRLHQVRHAQTLLLAQTGASLVDTEGERVRGEDAALVLQAGARELILPSGDTIPLGRRPQARRIIALLVQRRLEAPGSSVDVQCLFDAGWPGDAVTEPYRSNRVYVTMTRIRHAGLGPYLLHDGEGYLIDPSQPVAIA